jgi:hypothetical protein
MTVLVMSTKNFIQDLLVGWSLATGKIKDSYKKVSHIAERIGTQRAASTLACYGHYDIAEALRNSQKAGK